jgi:jumonji domain-containing protein 7
LLEIEREKHAFLEPENPTQEQLNRKWILPTKTLSRSAPSPNQNTCDIIDYIPTAAEFLNSYVSLSKPLVIKGGVKRWPALDSHRWTVDYLQSRVNNSIVKVYISPDSDFEAPKAMRDYRRLLRYVTSGKKGSPQDSEISDDEFILVRPAETEFTFNEFVHLLTNYSNPYPGSTFYLQKHSIYSWENTKLPNDLRPALFDEDYLQLHHTTTENKVVKQKRNKKGNKNKNKKGSNRVDVEYDFARFLYLQHYLMWMGKGFARGNIHYDANENLHAVIRGSKTFILFHPHKNMYEKEAYYRTAHFLYDYDKDMNEGKFWSLPVTVTNHDYQPFSPVNISDPNKEKHPLFNNIGRLECRVDEGDVIYIPSNWWHEVISEGSGDDNIFVGINMFFLPWFIKGSDLHHVSVNQLYQHLHDVSGKEINLELLRRDYWRHP